MYIGLRTKKTINTIPPQENQTQDVIAERFNKQVKKYKSFLDSVIQDY